MNTPTFVTIVNSPYDICKRRLQCVTHRLYRATSNNNHRLYSKHSSFSGQTMFNICIFLKLDKSRSWTLTAFSKRWIFTQKKIRNFCFIHKLDIWRFADNGKWPVQMSNEKNTPFKQNHSGSFRHPDKSGYIWFRARIWTRA
jgi:hypothetical protein